MIKYFLHKKSFPQARMVYLAEVPRGAESAEAQQNQAEVSQEDLNAKKETYDMAYKETHAILEDAVYNINSSEAIVQKAIALLRKLEDSKYVPESSEYLTPAECDNYLQRVHSILGEYAETYGREATPEYGTDFNQQIFAESVFPEGNTEGAKALGSILSSYPEPILDTEGKVLFTPGGDITEGVNALRVALKAGRVDPSSMGKLYKTVMEGVGTETGTSLDEELAAKYQKTEGKEKSESPEEANNRALSETIQLARNFTKDPQNMLAAGALARLIGEAEAALESGNRENINKAGKDLNMAFERAYEMYVARMEKQGDTPKTVAGYRGTPQTPSEGAPATPPQAVAKAKEPSPKEKPAT